MLTQQVEKKKTFQQGSVLCFVYGKERKGPTIGPKVKSYKMLSGQINPPSGPAWLLECAAVAAVKSAEHFLLLSFSSSPAKKNKKYKISVMV